MPSRNVLKIYVPGGIYHVYNRGVEKRDIFTDIQDYKTFLYFLKQYLIDPEDPKKDLANFKGRTFVRRSFYNRVELLAYCLMPNHFHLLIKQKEANDISEFMKCLATSYSMYFNDRHDRVGCLFQGRYKAVLVNGDEQLLHLSRYIHTNPLGKSSHIDKGPSFVSLEGYDYSSYQDYIGLRSTKWVNPNFLLNLSEQNEGKDKSDKAKVYKKFVEDFLEQNLVESLNGLELE